MSKHFYLQGWRVEPDANELLGKQGALKLDHKVMQLLVYFARNAGQDLSKEQILRDVWGEGVFSEEVLTVAVSSLRKALGDDARAPKFLKTLPRFGYRMLMAPALDPPVENRENWFELIDQRVGWRFLIVALIVILFLIVLLTRKHFLHIHFEQLKSE